MTTTETWAKFVVELEAEIATNANNETLQKVEIVTLREALQAVIDFSKGSLTCVRACEGMERIAYDALTTTNYQDKVVVDKKESA